MPSGAVWAVLVRPRLWRTAVVELARLAEPGWWRRWPPRPRPNADYLRFRMLTAYGDDAATVPAGELIDYLEWCRRMNALTSAPDRPMSLGGALRRASVTPVPPEPPAADPLDPNPLPGRAASPTAIRRRRSRQR